MSTSATRAPTNFDNLPANLTGELPASEASTVLGALAAIIAALVVAIGVRAVRIVSGKTPPRTTRGAVVRGSIAVSAGMAAAVAVLLGLSASTGAELSVAVRWAPDVAVLVWMLLGAIVVFALLDVVGQVVGCRHARGAR